MPRRPANRSLGHPLTSSSACSMHPTHISGEQRRRRSRSAGERRHFRPSSMRLPGSRPRTLRRERWRTPCNGSGATRSCRRCSPASTRRPRRARTCPRPLARRPQGGCRPGCTSGCATQRRALRQVPCYKGRRAMEHSSSSPMGRTKRSLSRKTTTGSSPIAPTRGRGCATPWSGSFYPVACCQSCSSCFNTTTRKYAWSCWNCSADRERLW